MVLLRLAVRVGMVGPSKTAESVTTVSLGVMIPSPFASLKDVIFGHQIP